MGAGAGSGGGERLCAVMLSGAPWIVKPGPPRYLRSSTPPQRFHGTEPMNSWTTNGLLALIAILVVVNLIYQAGRSTASFSPGGWSIACDNGLCVALDGAGNAYWGHAETGDPPGGGFRWYPAGNVRESQPFGVAACRERIARYERDRAALQAKLKSLPDPNEKPKQGEDAMEGAQQRMLARIARLDAQKKLDTLESQQASAVEACRKMVKANR